MVTKKTSWRNDIDGDVLLIGKHSACMFRMNCCQPGKQGGDGGFFKADSLRFLLIWVRARGRRSPEEISITREDCGSRKRLELMQESGTDHSGAITSLWGCQHFTEETSELRGSETFPKSHSACGRPGSGSNSYSPQMGSSFPIFPLHLYFDKSLSY